MLQKFKNLSKWMKLIIIVIAFILWPFTVITGLCLAAFYALRNTITLIKEKQYLRCIPYVILFCLLIFPLYSGVRGVFDYNNRINQIAEENNEAYEREHSSNVESINDTDTKNVKNK